MNKRQWRVGIFLFDDVEVLDFAGPFEVFSVTELENGHQPFVVETVSEKGNIVIACNGLKVQPDYSENGAINDICMYRCFIISKGWFT